MGLLADELRVTIARLKELDRRQAERTNELIESVDSYIRTTDALLEDLSDIGED